MLSAAAPLRAALAIVSLALVPACSVFGGSDASSEASYAPDLALTRAPAPAGGPARDQRIAIWRADVLLEVDDVEQAAGEVAALAKERGGFAEDTTLSDERIGSVRIRLPAADLEAALDALGAIGREKERAVSSEDVTEMYLDLETRLRNARELRDRLRALLAQAKTVKELLAVETELNRVQTEIESMDGQLTRLKGQVDLATVTVRLERRRILGPLGYVVKGIAWAVGKLFVIR
jgi:hypothetical protein